MSLRTAARADRGLQNSVTNVRAQIPESLFQRAERACPGRARKDLLTDGLAALSREHRFPDGSLAELFEERLPHLQKATFKALSERKKRPLTEIGSEYHLAMGDLLVECLSTIMAYADLSGIRDKANARGNAITYPANQLAKDFVAAFDCGELPPTG